METVGNKGDPTVVWRTSLMPMAISINEFNL